MYDKSPWGVYVITTDNYKKENIYKIGCSENINTRLSQMNATRFITDQFFIVKKWNTILYFDLETKLHQKLSKYRANNEFFVVDIDKIISTGEEILKERPTMAWHKDYLLLCFENKLIYNDNNEFIYETVKFSQEEMLEYIQYFLFEYDKYDLYGFVSKDHWLRLIDFLKDIYSITNKFKKMNIL